MPPVTTELLAVIRAKDEASRVTKSIGGGFAQLGKIIAKAMKIAAAAVAAIAVISFKVGKDFKQALQTVGTIANATAQEFRELEATARTIGKTTAFSAQQAAEGMYNLVSAGLDTKQTMLAVENALFLAGATAGDMTTATTLMASTLKVFNLDAAESARISDTFAQAITSSMFTLQSLTEAMKFAAPTGATLGWTIEQTTAAVAQFANMGLEGSMAGTLLRMAMNQLLKPTKEVKDTLTRLGITYEDINPATNDFAEILESLAESNMTAADAVGIFGARAGGAMFNLIKRTKEGTVDVERLTKQLEDSAGRAAEMYDQMMDTVEGRFQIFKSSLSETFIAIFDFIQPMIKTVLEGLTSLLDSAREAAIESAEGIGKAMHGAVSVLGAVVTTVHVVVRALWDALKIFGTIVKGLVSVYVLIVETPFALLKAAIANTLNFITLAITNMIDAVNPALRKLIPEEVLFSLGQMRQKTMEWAQEANQGVIDVGKGFEDLGTGAIDYAKSLGNLGTEAEAANEKIADFITGLHDNVEEAIDAIVRLREIQLEGAGDVAPAPVIDTEDIVVKNRLSAEEVQEVWTSAFGNISDAARSFGEAAGGESETLFAIQKAAAIAEATINAYQAATKALAQYGPVFGPPLAATVFAAAMGNVAAIQAQELAEGGLVMKPTLALIGEAGPEAVIPLNKGMGGVATNNFNATITGPFMGTPEEARFFAREMNRYFQEESSR